MLTQSPWEYEELFKAIFDRAKRLLSKQPSYLLIDEVGFRKKGTHSACVGTQYLGCIGKHDNGQVAVSAALSAGNFYCPISLKLFMPQDWNDDLLRRSKAGIPPRERHQTKTAMALDMIMKSYKTISSVECVVFDALYGGSIDLLEQLMNNKISFVGDVKKSQRIYIKRPSWKVPPYNGTGRPFLRERPSQQPIQLQHHAASLTARDFKLIKIRKGTKGYVKAYFYSQKVWVLHEASRKFLPLELLIRKEINGKVKFSLCSFNSPASIQRLAKAQAQRVFIERIFEEGKNIVGMGDFQTRSWIGFHRHMALASLALLFIMEQKIALTPSLGRVTAYQIQRLLITSLKIPHAETLIIDRCLKQIINYRYSIENHFKLVT